MLSRFSCIWLFVTLWSEYRPPGSSVHGMMCKIPSSIQEHWSGLPCPPPGDLSDPGIEPTSLLSPAWQAGCFTTAVTWEAHGSWKTEGFPKLPLSQGSLTPQQHRVSAAGRTETRPSPKPSRASLITSSWGMNILTGLLLTTSLLYSWLWLFSTIISRFQHHDVLMTLFSSTSSKSFSKTLNIETPQIRRLPLWPSKSPWVT